MARAIVGRMGSSTSRLPRKLRAAFGAVTGPGRDGARTPFARLRLLEPACGAGQHLVHLDPGSLGLDRDPRALEEVQRLGLRAIGVDLDAPGWADAAAPYGPFEGAFLADCLVHLRRPEVALSELRSLLPQGAPLVLVEWTRPERESSALGRWTSLLQAAVPGARAHWQHPEHLHHWPESRWWSVLAEAGFGCERRILHSFPPALLAVPLLEPALASFWPPRLLIAR